MSKIESFYNDIFLKYRKVSTDSRTIEKGSIFFSLSGNSFNGNSFAASALEKGAAIAVVDDKNYYMDNGSYYLVDDCLSFLQELARIHRFHFHCPVIGITGTNGKTTTKELVSGALSLKYKTYFTHGNLNNHIGVPLTLLSVDERDAQFVVVEMGANHPHEIQQLCGISDPDYGIITSIGVAHLEGFGNVETIIETKTALYRHVAAKHGIVFVNSDSEVLMKNKPDSNVIFYGSPQKSFHVNCCGSPDNSSINVKFDWRYESMPLYHVQSSMYGQYNYTNMLASACIAAFFYVNTTQINDFLVSYNSSNNRSQVIRCGDVTFISDAYNANPSSMAAALDSFGKIDADNKVVILGDMFELGENTLKEHSNIVEKLGQMHLKEVYLVGENFSAVSRNFNTFKTTDETLAFLAEHPLENCLVLLKGSRGMKLEKVLAAMEKGN